MNGKQNITDVKCISLTMSRPNRKKCHANGRLCMFGKCVCVWVRVEAWIFILILAVVVIFLFLSHLHSLYFFFWWSLLKFSLIWHLDIRPVWPDSNRTFISFSLYTHLSVCQFTVFFCLARSIGQFLSYHAHKFYEIVCIHFASLVFILF